MEPAHFALALALMPIIFGAINLMRMPRPRGTPAAGTRVSILVPARNEAANIAACLDAALASTGYAAGYPTRKHGGHARVAHHHLHHLHHLHHHLHHLHLHLHRVLARA